jgi:hypothetical protein
MKNYDSSLDRLLRSAGQDRRAVTEAAPFGFATRVAASWVAGMAGERLGQETLWFRRAFLCALAVMAISVGWSFKTDTAAPNDEMAIASYAATADLQ